MATNTGSPYFIPFPEDNDPVDVAGDFETLATHLNNNLEEYISDTIGLLVTGNTENGIVVTVDEATNKVNFDVNDPVISLSGDVSGSATMTNLSNTDIAVTIQPNSVELGVDTYGPYVATITGTENQIDVLGSGTEDSDVILSLPQDIDSGAEPTFAGATLGEIQVGITDDNEIDTVTGNLTIDSEGGTVIIDDDVDVSGNLAAPTLDLDLTTPPTYLEGRVYYDTETNSLAVYDNVTDNSIYMNQSVYIFGENNTAFTITKGSIVSCGGFDTDATPLLVLASNDDSGRMPAIGVAMENIAAGERGKVMLHGKIEGLNTTGFGLGATLFVGEEGVFTEDRPVGDEALFQVIGRVGKIDSTDGCILVAIDPVADLVPNLPNKHVWVGNEDAHAVATTDPNVNSLTLDSDLAVNGGDITTTSTTTSIFNANATTINFGGEATDIQIGSDTGTTNINNDLDVDGDTLVNGNFEVDGDAVIDGNLTVHGTTTTINSVVSTTDDPVFVIGGDTLPETDDNKDRGIEFRWHNGTSAKTGFFGFDDSSGRFTFIPDGTNTSEVFSGTLGDVEIGTLYTVGDVVISGQELNSTTTTFNLLNDTATTINFGGAGTDIQIGSSTGTTNINNNLDVDGDLNIDGGDLTASTSVFNLLHTPTTINFGAAATDIQIGSASGTTNVNNNLDVDGDINVDGGDLTVSSLIFNLANSTAETINFGGSATDIQIGSANGTTNINNNLDVDGDVSIDGGDLTASTSTFNLLNNTVTTLNLAGEATAITIGATTGTTTFRNDVSVNGNVTINPDSVGPALVIGANAMNQLITGLNSDLLDGQTGTWYQSRDNHTGTQLHSTISDWLEQLQDDVSDMLVHDLHSNLIAEYNDFTGKVIFTAPGLGSGFGNTAGVSATMMYWFGV